MRAWQQKFCAGCVLVQSCLLCWLLVRDNSSDKHIKNDIEKTSGGNMVVSDSALSINSRSTSTWNDRNLLVMYNRIPKTGSTTFMEGVTYGLAVRNGYSVVMLNVTRNQNTLHLGDQVWLAQNMSSWVQRKPAVYHGHLAFIDFTRFGMANPIYINVVREPIERLVTYYYFLRCGDDYRPGLIRSRMGDKQSFDECVQKGGSDCALNKMWLQIPFFCGHSAQCWKPGSNWALSEAKHNLLRHYLLVGTTNNLTQFVTLLERILPQIWRGASAQLAQPENAHIRRTKCRVPPSAATISQLQSSLVWTMENEFYEFAQEQFNYAWNRMYKNVQPGETPRGEINYKKVRPKIRNAN